MREIHILNPMENPFGGSERRTLALADLLAPHAEVRIWSFRPADPGLRCRTPITPADVSKLRFPRSGTLVIVGCYFELPTWISVMRPERVIVVFNVPVMEHLSHMVYVLRAFGVRRIEIVAANRSLAEVASKLGEEVLGVEPSWIDLKIFSPCARSKTEAFTVGRHSRDVPEKFHSEDPGMYQTLAQSGIRVQIMGGGVLKPSLNGEAGIEVLPAGAKRSEVFLKCLDAFVYRTSEAWQEAWGRVAAEAMACGLPVILDRRVGLLEALDPGKDVEVFDKTDEAVELVLALQSDADRRARLGAAARQSAERIFGMEAKRNWISAYLGSGSR